VLFMLAGFDSTQTLLLYTAYALALNQDVQEKLREEVGRVLEETDGEFTYEGLGKMTYLDMVIKETLRYWPPGVQTDRQCVKEYKIPGTDVLVNIGDVVNIPIYGFHRDPQFYPNPTTFDPERFSAESKGKINQYAYLPFSHGPRNCIGMRFALTEARVAVAQLVHNFNIQPSKKTLIPMVYDKSGSIKPKGGMYLALTKIQR